MPWWLVGVAASAAPTPAYVGNGGVERPTWSPDGRWVAVVDRHRGHEEPVVVAVRRGRGQQAERVPPPSRGEWVGPELRFRPDGSLLLAARASRADVARLWTWVPGEGAVTPLVSTDELPGSFSDVAVSPDGLRIVFAVTTADGTDLYTRDHDGVHRLTTSPEVEAHPAFWPDGSRVLFERGGDLWEVGFDEAPEHPFSVGPETEARPTPITLDRAVWVRASGEEPDPGSWALVSGGAVVAEGLRLPAGSLPLSPDHAWVAFARGDRDRSDAVWLTDPDGTRIVEARVGLPWCADPTLVVDPERRLQLAVTAEDDAGRRVLLLTDVTDAVAGAASTRPGGPITGGASGGGDVDRDGVAAVGGSTEQGETPVGDEGSATGSSGREGSASTSRGSGSSSGPSGPGGGEDPGPLGAGGRGRRGAGAPDGASDGAVGSDRLRAALGFGGVVAVVLLLAGLVAAEAARRR